MSSQAESKPDENVQGKRKAEDDEIEPDKKIIKKSRKVIRPGFGEEKYSETEYYFENGEYIFRNL